MPCLGSLVVAFGDNQEGFDTDAEHSWSNHLVDFYSSLLFQGDSEVVWLVP